MITGHRKQDLAPFQPATLHFVQGYTPGRRPKRKVDVKYNNGAANK